MFHLLFVVDGKYSPWSQWSACSKTCGYGIQTRKRTCTDPEPQHGGRDCTDLGDPEHIRPCQVIQCPSKLQYDYTLRVILQRLRKRKQEDEIDAFFNQTWRLSSFIRRYGGINW